MLVNRPSTRTLLGCIVLLGAAVRCFHIGTEPFWLDEMYSVWFSQRSFKDLWTIVPHYEGQSPFYYTLLKLWASGNYHEAWIRGLSCVASVLCIPTTYSIVRALTPHWASDRAGLAAAVALALSPIQVVYAQDARPYALLTLAVAITFLGLVQFCVAASGRTLPVDSVSARGRVFAAQTNSAWILIAGLSTAMWAHPTSIALVGGPVVVFCLWIVTKSGNKVRDGLVLAAVGALVLLAWSAFALWTMRLMANPARGFWSIPPTPKNIVSGLDVLLGSAGRASSFPVIRGICFAAMVLMTAAGVVKAFRNGLRTGAIAAAAVILLPVAISILISWTATPIFLPRSMVWISVGQAAAIAWFVVLGRSDLILVRLAASVACMSLGLSMFFINHTNGDPWPTLDKNIQADTAVSVMVVTVPNFLVFPMDWYWGTKRQNAVFLPMPAAFPALDWDRQYPSGLLAEPSISTSDLPMFAVRVARTDSVWLVTRFYELFDNRRLLFNYLVCSRGTPFAWISSGSLGVWRFGPPLLFGKATAECLRVSESTPATAPRPTDTQPD
jgi:mannosyltransferase